MAETRSLAWNGYRVASTFSGAGGSCLGYRLAGFKVVYASEFIPAAADTYAANHPETLLDRRDIRTVAGADILDKIGLGVGELDLLDGSPPCASFSTSGKREKLWGRVKKYSDSEQRTDDLFFEYARLVREIRPKTFVAENVSGLVKGVAKGYFLDIIESLAACGYRVEARLLDAQWLGVPQRRERVIFVGVRDDLGLAPAFPRPFERRVSLREALAGLPPEPPIEAQRLKGKTLLLARQLAPGQSGDALTGGSYFSLGRLAWERPTPTVCAQDATQASTTMVHPDETRRLSISELKRVCSFPDDYRLTGTFAQQWERLGRSVPPLMMKAVAEAVGRGVLDKCR